jgi:hypothetical protein
MFMDRVTCRESCKRHMAVSGKVRRGKRGFSAMANDIYKRARFQLLCGFAVPELLKSALVVVLVVLATHLIFAFLWPPENRHIGGVVVF